MTKAEIIAELPRLTPEDRAEVQAKLDELSGDSWQDNGELTEADKTTLNASLAAYQKDPNSGSPWDQVKVRIQSKLQR